MTRGACFGACPIYKLTIQADGTVDYEGLEFVRIEGKRQTKISGEQIDELVTAIETMKFFSLKDEYPPNATDMPVIALSITLDGHSKTIRHYGMVACGVEKATEDLCEFEHQVNDVVNSNPWVEQEN